MMRLLAWDLVGDASAGVLWFLLHRLFLDPIPFDRYWLVLLVPCGPLRGHYHDIVNSTHLRNRPFLQ